MRIKTLAEKAGISRRNIHFYLQQGLLNPQIDPENGYYCFVEEDLVTLRTIKKLRDAGLSLASIRSMLQTPKTTEYYLRMHLNRIRQEREKMLKTEEDITEILLRISANPSLEEAERLILEEIRELENMPLPYDAYLVNHFLWRTYDSGEEKNEYQEFLQEKIYRMTNTPEKNEDYAKLNVFLNTEDQRRIDQLYAERATHYQAVAKMNDEEIEQYADRMKENIVRFLDNPNLILSWKQNMEDFYWPMIRIYTTRIGKIAEEMYPLFKTYKTKSQTACRLVYEWLVGGEGQPVAAAMAKRLGKQLDIHNYEHAVLESINLSMIFTQQSK